MMARRGGAQQGGEAGEHATRSRCKRSRLLRAQRFTPHRSLACRQLPLFTLLGTQRPLHNSGPQAGAPTKLGRQLR